MLPLPMPCKRRSPTLNPTPSEVSSLNGKIGYMRNVLCYSQRYEDSFFSLERLPNTHEGETEPSPESHQ